MFDWLLRRKRSTSLTPSVFVCSRCYERHPCGEMHALPWWNPDASAFFMATRCAACFPASLAEARERVKRWDPEAEAEFRSFLDIWKVEARMPGLAQLSPHEAAEAVLDHTETTDGREFAAVFLAQPIVTMTRPPGRS